MENKRVRAKVHMLPTENKQDNIPLHLGRDNKLRVNYSKRCANDFSEKAQHLYFTTDEKIVEGDWCLHLKYGVRKVYPDTDLNFIVTNPNTNSCILSAARDYHKKIVASTDESLGLPQPSQAFIKKYCEVGGIEEVDIELKSSDLDYFFGDLKVDPIHNTVTIHSIKDSWSREELTDILQVYRLDYEQYKRSCHYGPNQKEIVDWSNKWIKENL